MLGQGRKTVEMAADAGNAAGGGELRYAGFWARVAALIFDNALVTVFCLVLIAGASFAGDAAVLIAMAVCLLFALLYWPLLESSVRQATFGKQLLGIQVSDLEGGRLSFARSLLRNLAKIVSSLFFFAGFLLAGLTARKQALHDMIVGCLVVRLGPPDLFKAAASSVAGLMIILGGWYYFVASAYIPHAIAHLEKQMRGTGALLQKGLDKALQGAQPGAPGVKPPAPAAQPATATPPVPSPAPPVVTVTPEVPPVTAPAPATASKPAPAKPAAEARSAASPVKPVVPAVKPKPAPAPVAELVSEPPTDQPRPARRTTVPRPAAEPAAPVSAAPPRPVVTPKYNDVMTAVMYRDAAGVTQLLDLGWWVDRTDSNGVSPLMAAAWIGDLALVQLLLQRGANPNLRARGGSVLEYAGRSEDVIVLDLLKQAGAR
jgi:uncharacterized RDD family membrane protein YckC